MSCSSTTVGTSTATAVRCRCYWTSDQSGKGTQPDLPTRLDQPPVDCCYKCCVPASALTARRLVTIHCTLTWELKSADLEMGLVGLNKIDISPVIRLWFT